MSPRYRVVKCFRIRGEPPEWLVATEEAETADVWVVLDTFPQKWQADQYVNDILTRHAALKGAK